MISHAIRGRRFRCLRRLRHTVLFHEGEHRLQTGIALLGQIGSDRVMSAILEHFDFQIACRIRKVCGVKLTVLGLGGLET